MKPIADFDSVKLGDRSQLIKTISQDDIRKFVEMTGDDNPLHVDREFANETPFKDIVVHGMLGASFISTVIGTQLPGPGALWVSQAMDFLLPVRLGDELTISCTVLKKYDRERMLELETVIVNQNRQTVLQGTGKVKLLALKPAPAPKSTDPERKKVAIVTGGAGGIGEAICERLAIDGFRVVLNYNGSRARAQAIAARIIEAGGEAFAIQSDIAETAGAELLFEQAIARFGAVDALINGASPRINPRPFLDTDWDDMQHHMDVQLKGAFRLTQLCVRDMMTRKSGRIVNITSQVTKGQPTVQWTAYAVAKAALAMFTRNIAAELGPSGITVNCVSPGMTETALIGDISEKQQMIVGRQTPMRRLAQPVDVAGAVSYLLSADAGFVTGHTIDVNGGMAMS